MKKVQAYEHAYFVLMFGIMAVASVFAQIVDLADIVGPDECENNPAPPNRPW